MKRRRSIRCRLGRHAWQQPGTFVGEVGVGQVVIAGALHDVPAHRLLVQACTRCPAVRLHAERIDR